MARGVAVVLAAGVTAGCSMIGELELRGPVLPGTLFMILALLVGIFAVAGLRYAGRASASESGKDRGSDNVA
jgi:hypothetical protein